MIAISKLLILIVLGIFLTTACTATPPEQNPDPTPEEPSAEATDLPPTETEQDPSTNDEPEPTPDRSIRSEESDETELPEPASTTESQPSTGEVPDDLIQAILEDFSQVAGSSRENVEIVRAETAVWNDGSLGCPKPGEVYTQSPTQGYWVVLSHNGREYDYRATNTSYFFLCNNPLPPGGGGAPIG